MTDTMMTIIGIFVAVILMVIFPLVEVTGKNDDIAQTAVQIAVADFVNTVATNGKITEGDYNKLIQKIYATGNSYDVIIEAKILDENPERRTVATQGTGSLLAITESQYYSVYTDEIVKQLLNTDEKEYLLKKDDYIYVTIKNTSLTLGTQLRGIFYQFLGKDNYTIGAEASSLIINTGVTDKKNLQITSKPDNLYWYMSMKKHTSVTSIGEMKPFNVIYIMDYSGSMARSNVERMHKTLEAQVQTLIGYAQKNPALQFKVSIVGFGDYAKELVRITVNSTYNISALQTELNGILNVWQDAYQEDDYIYGGLQIRSDTIFGNRNIGPGTSYRSASFLGNIVLENIKASSNNDNYVIFMTDGANEDGVNPSVWEDVPQSYLHQEYLALDDFKVDFQKLKDSSEGVYVIAYNTGRNAQLNWCVGGIKKGGIFDANNSNLANILGQITLNMSTTLKIDDVTVMQGRTKLESIDPSKPLTIKITYNDKTIESSISVNDATFIKNESGEYYLYSKELEDYYKDQIIVGYGEAVAIAVDIIYYGVDIQEGI